LFYKHFVEPDEELGDLLPPRSSQGVVVPTLNDRNETLAAVKEDGMALRRASEEFKGDREVVLAAVRQYGAALLFASQELREDREVVLAAVRQNGEALLFASQKLQRDPEVLAAANLPR
jgi:hypothetical protein